MNQSPTQLAHRRMKDRERRINRVFKKIWGPNVKDILFEGSPHEGETLNAAEIITHELAHQTLMPAGYVFPPGSMEKSSAWSQVQEYLGLLRPRFLADVHEVKALAISLLVSDVLKMGLSEDKLLNSALLNTQFFRYHKVERLARAVNKAKKLKSIQFKAEMIVYLFDETRRRNRK